MARNHAVFAAIALGLLGVSASASAQSQECTQDTDCAVGNWCVFDAGEATKPGVPVSDEPCPPDDPNCASEPPPDVEPTKGTCEPLPKGLCVEDADCSAGLKCVIGTVGTDCAEPAPAPVDGGTSGAPIAPPSDCVPSEEPAPYGYCTLPETVCTSDAMCLPGLKCVDGGQSSGGSPGAAPACEPNTDCGDAFPSDPPPMEEDPAPAPSTCQVSFTACTADTDCESGYECIETGKSCTSSGTSGSGGSATGTVDPAQPKQNDPECQTESYCYPKYTPCTTDAQCQANWVCYTFDDQTLEAPDWWEQEGTVQACLPKGLALAAEAGGFGRDSGGAGGAPTGAPEVDNASGDDGTKGAVVPGSGDGNSCAVGFGPRGEGAAFLFVALGMLVRRRRVRA